MVENINTTFEFSDFGKESGFFEKVISLLKNLPDAQVSVDNTNAKIQFVLPNKTISDIIIPAIRKLLTQEYNSHMDLILDFNNFKIEYKTANTHESVGVRTVKFEDYESYVKKF